MHKKNGDKNFKNTIITRFMIRVKAFNERHRKCAKVTTAFALIIVAILSILLGIAEKICDIFEGVFESGKRLIAVLAIVLLIAAIILASNFAKNSHHADILDESDTSTDQIIGTLVEAELSKVEDSMNVSVESEKTEESIKGASVGADDSEENKQGVSKEATESEESVDNVAVEADKSAESTQGTSEDMKKSEKSIEDVAVESTEAQKTTEDSQKTDDLTLTKENVLDLAAVDLESFMKEYPETVGWLYFEDGHISYPIMQDGDNNKYRKLDYTGEEARTGAIFLDYRSAADFSDSNSIIYGHYMKDRTMFGTLRDYREDPKYYNDHQYFQVITPDKIYRYQIFAYMDVPKSYVIYDYIGDASYEFVKDAEPVRIKSYMDSEIVVNKTKKVVTLSTCTDKDKLYFVVLGVMVEEKDR